MAAKGERLSVWMHGRLIATLTKQKERLELAYSKEAQDAYEVNTPLISVALPVFPGTFKHDKVRPFFDGLLPEGEARRMLAYDFRISEDDAFGFLRALGRDCAGALVILPEDERLPPQGGGEAFPLTAEQVTHRIRQLETEPLGVDHQVRISLAGVQYKLVLSLLPTGQWALPIGGRPSTHILKRANPRFANMVANEAYCLAIGRHLGLDMAQARIMTIPDEILVVTRYDRTIIPNGNILRIHQEDLTQALSIPSSAKYQEHGGPGLRRVASLLRDATGNSYNLERLLDVTFLNMVVGNADAHAKNFSLLHPEPGVVRLAPAYDIMSTTYYPQADVRPGMYVHQKTSILDVTTTDVIEEAVTWGLSRNRVRARVAALLEKLPAALGAAATEVPSVPQQLITHVSARADRFRLP